MLRQFNSLSPSKGFMQQKSLKQSKSSLQVYSGKSIEEKQHKLPEAGESQKMTKKQLNICKENSPKKPQAKTSSPFKVYRTNSPAKKTLQPYLPDRESPTKGVNLFMPFALDTPQPFNANLRTLINNRKIREDVKDFIKLDCPLLSFGKFISGKTLGSNLTLTNTAAQRKTITLSIWADQFT